MYRSSKRALKHLWAFCIVAFIHMSIYYIILLMVIPFLRKWISARACATLWLIPNFLYILNYWMDYIYPLITISISSRLLTICASIWLIGFVVVFGWYLMSHLLFRRSILKDAIPVIDQKILDLYEKEIAEAQIQKPKFGLVTTKDISTPMTIGLFERSIMLVLPDNDYSEEELHLIFKHELIHISRLDEEAKFFMMFCTAMCWFNPLVWRAMKKSAEDIELSCDETVLLDVDDDTRNLYAHLILNVAGDDRGISTCFSSSASSMCYRLKSIVSPKKHTGALTIGLTMLILTMTFGSVSLAYGEKTGSNTIFANHDLREYHITGISGIEGEKEYFIDHKSADALTRYLADLQTQERLGSNAFTEEKEIFTISYDGPDGRMTVDLQHNCIRIRHYHDDIWIKEEVYYLPKPFDKKYIKEMVFATSNIDSDEVNNE